ncbi:MAG: hypothetical protein ACREXT_11090, partial [Gammaproteobacteria bacterium]
PSAGSQRNLSVATTISLHTVSVFRGHLPIEGGAQNIMVSIETFIECGDLKRERREPNTC